jgi:hypothetical protein
VMHNTASVRRCGRVRVSAIDPRASAAGRRLQRVDPWFSREPNNKLAISPGEALQGAKMFRLNYFVASCLLALTIGTANANTVTFDVSGTFTSPFR